MKEQLAWNNMIADDIDQLRNIIYRLENKILALEQQQKGAIEFLAPRIATLELAIKSNNCDTCD